MHTRDDGDRRGFDGSSGAQVGPGTDRHRWRRMHPAVGLQPSRCRLPGPSGRRHRLGTLMHRFVHTGQTRIGGHETVKACIMSLSSCSTMWQWWT